MKNERKSCTKPGMSTKRRIGNFFVVRNRIRIERISFGTYALLLLKHYYSGRKERYTTVQ